MAWFVFSLNFFKPILFLFFLVSYMYVYLLSWPEMKSDLYTAYVSQTGLKSFNWIKLWNNIFISCNPNSSFYVNTYYLHYLQLYLPTSFFIYIPMVVVWQEAAVGWSETVLKPLLGNHHQPMKFHSQEC